MLINCCHVGMEILKITDLSSLAMIAMADAAQLMAQNMYSKVYIDISSSVDSAREFKALMKSGIDIFSKQK